MDTDKLISRSLASTMAAVAGFAAVVSYSHIYDLGARHLYHGSTAYLLPLSVDGLIVYSSLVLLHAARQKLEVPVLGRLTLWLGILATVAANVAYGLPGGLLGAIVSAWPAVAFICTVETGMQLARSQRIRARRTYPPKDTGEARSTPKPKQEIEFQDVAVESTAAAIIRSERRKMDDMKAAVAGVPSIRDLMRELGCGQSVATDVQKIMRESNVDANKARIMREEAKNG